MDEIVCANTAFRYWRCPPQVHDLYPRLPSSDDGWRTLSQAPFVTDVLKTPIIAVASPGCCNHHSGLRSTIRWEGASDTGTTTDTHLGFSVTNPLNTLFTMTRFVSQIDLVLAMYELCGWFSVFEPAPAAEMQLKMAVEENRNSSTQYLFELGEGEDEVPWKRVYARATVKDPENDSQTSKEAKTGERRNPRCPGGAGEEGGGSAAPRGARPAGRIRHRGSLALESAPRSRPSGARASGKFFQNCPCIVVRVPV